jgi:predicted deacylase
MSADIDVAQYAVDLEAAARAAGFSVDVYGFVEQSRLVGLSRQAEPGKQSSRAVYLSAGIHGDEPAGPLALLELLRADALPRHHDWVICPLLNPSGLKKGTRENAAGIDLNRDYRDFVSHEIRGHREWVKRQIKSIDLGIHLHEDWESQGFYLYELNFADSPSQATALLDAARQYLPIETAECIDGRRASGGIIRPETLPDLPEGHPESIWLYQQYGGVLYTLETPSTAALDRRVAALKAAVLAAVDP